MPVMRRSAHVPYSALQMLKLVNDIDAYPEFLHWCRDARIERSDDGTVDAALEIGVSGFRRTLRTRNTTRVREGDGEAWVDIEMIDGPLAYLSGGWVFADVAPGECEVTLSLDYEMQRTPFGQLLHVIFEEIANSQLHAFVRRAREIYGA